MCEEKQVADAALIGLSNAYPANFKKPLFYFVVQLFIFTGYRLPESFIPARELCKMLMIYKQDLCEPTDNIIKHLRVMHVGISHLSSSFF